MKHTIDGLMEILCGLYGIGVRDGEAGCGYETSDRHAIEAAVRAYAEAMLPQWVDIASAPKDGTHILVSAGDRVSIGGWLSDIDQGAEWEGQIGMAGWWAVDLGPHNDKPTHWMPLPPPPTDSTKGN